MSMSIGEARRIVLAAQGFGRSRLECPSVRHLRGTAERLNLFQIDSVNVPTRAHYLPAFSRLGGYDCALLDGDAWGPTRQRRMFEHRAHEASLLPLDLHPLLRWRMARAKRDEIGSQGLRRFALDLRPEANAVLERITAEGPLTAADFENGLSRSG